MVYPQELRDAIGRNYASGNRCPEVTAIALRASIVFAQVDIFRQEK